MFETISFYIGNKHLGLYDQEYLLGELTTEILNIPRDKYIKMRKTLERAQDYSKKYERGRNVDDWFHANEAYIQIDELLSEYRVFRLLKSDTQVLYEARELTQQYSLLTEQEDCAFSSYDAEVYDQICRYEAYLQHPEEYGGEDYIVFVDEKDRESTIPIERPDIPPVPPEKTRALLIIPGSMEMKWSAYKQYCSMYESVLLDIDDLHYTFKNFIKFSLSKLKTLNANTYVGELGFFLFDPRIRQKLVSNPASGTGNLTTADEVTMYHIPKETSQGSGIFKVYEYYEVKKLQAMIKLDFYKALEAGHLIRKCECCGRFFLLEKGYHTKYCDTPNPDNPDFTCAQMGYYLKGVKEIAADDPKTQSLVRCLKRLEKDLSRGTITVKEHGKLTRKAKDLYHEARLSPKMTYQSFEKSLESKNLYRVCNVIRKSKPRGRPKKET